MVQGLGFRVLGKHLFLMLIARSCPPRLREGVPNQSQQANSTKRFNRMKRRNSGHVTAEPFERAPRPVRSTNP